MPAVLPARLPSATPYRNKAGVSTDTMTESTPLLAGKLGIETTPKLHILLATAGLYR